MTIDDFKKLNIKPLFPISEEPEFCSEVELASSMLANRAKSSSFGLGKPLSVRLDLSLAHFIEVSAKRSGNTKTDVVSSLLKAGIQASWAQMTQEERDSFLADFDKFIDLSDVETSELEN